MTRSARQRQRRRRRRRMMKVLPSMFTLGNCLCGFAAIFYASRPADAPHILDHLTPLTIAAWLIFIGMVFDALDGRVARMTRHTSDLGEQLDSMSDMVSFGVAPAFLVIQLVGIGTPFFAEAPDLVEAYFDRIVLVVAGIYVACCALRLARFNIEIDNPEEADHMSFKGLPSPAAAGTVAALVLLHQHLIGRQADTWAVVTTGVVMVVVALLVALAMVSTMRYTHLLNRYLRGRAPFRFIATVVIVIIAAAIHPQLAAAAGFVAYALSAPIRTLFSKARGPRKSSPPDDNHSDDQSGGGTAADTPDDSAADDDSPPLRFGAH